MYRLFLSLSFLLTASIALAQGPYLVSDPYPADEDQPDEFVIMLNGTEYTSAAVANNDGLLYLRFDLDGIWNDGQNDLTVKARNMWGESILIPFAFTAGVPGEAGNLRIVSSDPGP
jgi:hypothetical protein